MDPFYAGDWTTLYRGDCREVLPLLELTVDACVTDPPYQETSSRWDRWPDGWVKAVGGVLPSSASLWCFGSARMFLDRLDDFSGWRYAQEQLWAKANGSGPGSRDRLLRVHEWAYHWYRGRWGDLHHEWEREPAREYKGLVRRQAPAAAHRQSDRATAWQDDGTRQPRSVAVIEAPSVRGVGRHPAEKPVSVVLPLVRECTPPGGVVLDPFAGSGTTAIAARLIGRRSVLIEADEHACSVIVERLRAEQTTLSAPTPEGQHQ